MDILASNALWTWNSPVFGFFQWANLEFGQVKRCGLEKKLPKTAIPGSTAGEL